MSEADTPSMGSVLFRGLRGRCPKCGRGKLFSGYLSVANRCGVCGQSFAEHDAADGPAVFGIFIVGGAVVALALILERWLSPPLWVHAVVWAPCIIGGSLAILRPIKGLTIALQHHFRSIEKPFDDRRW
jgi:uncharacterized protein (DUF983 family)